MTRISPEQVHDVYRAQGFAGKEDVVAFDTLLDEGANHIQSLWRELRLNPGITHIPQHHEYSSKHIGLVHTVVAGSQDQQVMGFGNLIAMKNIFPSDVFAVYETRVYVREQFWGRGISKQLLTELYAHAYDLHLRHQNCSRNRRKPTLMIETVLIPDLELRAKAKKSIIASLKSLGATQIISWDSDFLVTLLAP